MKVPSFQITLELSVMTVEDVDGNKHVMEELIVTGYTKELREFIEKEAVENGEVGPMVEFLISPIVED